MIDSTATAKIDQSVRLPDYFGCQGCPASGYSPQDGYCDRFQRAGRCRAALLGQAVAAGAVQIHLHVAPAALQAGGGR